MKKQLVVFSITLGAVGCGPKLMTKPVGEVVKVTDRTVMVYYQVVTRRHGDVVGNTFYFENGHDYRVGDPFPKGMDME